MRHYLVVANQTLGGKPLANAVTAAMQEEACTFHIVVPATPPKHQLTYTEGEARGLALERLEKTLARLDELGAEVTGEVGDARPMDAIADAVARQHFDHLIVSTFPHAISRWLRQDLPHRAANATGLPVTHVVTEPSDVD